MNRFLNIVALQFDIIWEDKEANFQKIRDMISRLDSKPDLIVLPETFATGFTMKSETFAESQMELTEKFLIEISKKTGAVIGGSWMEKNPDGMLLHDLLELLPIVTTKFIPSLLQKRINFSQQANIQKR